MAEKEWKFRQKDIYSLFSKREDELNFESKAKELLEGRKFFKLSQFLDQNESGYRDIVRKYRRLLYDAEKNHADLSIRIDRLIHSIQENEELESLVKKIDDLLKNLATESNNMIIISVFRELVKLSPERQTLKDLSEILFDSGNYRELSEVLWEMFEKYPSGRFAEDMIRSMKRVRYFPDRLKRLYVYVLISLGSELSLRLELSIWGEILLKDEEERKKLCEELVLYNLVEQFLPQAAQVISKKLYITVLNDLFHESGKQKKRLVQARLGMHLVDEGAPDIDRRKVIRLLIEFKEFGRALEYAELLPAKSEFCKEITEIHDQVCTNRSLKLLLSGLYEAEEFAQLESYGVSYFGEFDPFASWLISVDLLSIFLHISIDRKEYSQQVLEVLAKLSEEKRWEELSDASLLLINKGKRKHAFFPFIHESLERTGRLAEIREDLDNYLEGMVGKERVEFLLSMEEYDCAAMECQKLLDADYSDLSFLIRKLDEIRFKKLLKTGKESNELSLYMARVLAANHEEHKAVFEYEKYLDHRPDDSQAVFELLNLYLPHGKSEKADDLARRLMKLAPDNHEYQKVCNKVTGEVTVSKLYKLM